MWQKIKHLFKRQSDTVSFIKYDEALNVLKELACGHKSRKQYNILISKAQQYLNKYDVYKHYKKTEEQTPDNEAKIGGVYKLPCGAVAIVIGKELQWSMMEKKLHGRYYLWYYRDGIPEITIMDEKSLLAQHCYGAVPVFDFFWQAKTMVFDKTGW